MKGKKRRKQGFTLAELLIVVAIISVLTAIAIPVYSGLLEKAKEAVDLSNIRAAYAEVAMLILDGKEDVERRVEVMQAEEGWETANQGARIGQHAIMDVPCLQNIKAGQIVVVSMDKDGNASFTVESAP